MYQPLACPMAIQRSRNIKLKPLHCCKLTRCAMEKKSRLSHLITAEWKHVSSLTSRSKWVTGLLRVESNLNRRTDQTSLPTNRHFRSGRICLPQGRLPALRQCLVGVSRSRIVGEEVGCPQTAVGRSESQRNLKEHGATSKKRHDVFTTREIRL